MKVLVIGASGFLGTALCDELRRRGCEVVGTARMRPDLARLDVGDPAAVTRVLESVDPDTVVNLAASGVTAANAKVVDLERTNVVGARNVAVAVSQLARSPWYIHAASSTEVHHAPPGVASESAYSRTKRSGTAGAGSILRGAGVPHSIARIHNTYGPGQPTGRLVRDAIDTLGRYERVVLRHPDRVRDFCFVDDVVRHVADIVERKHTALSYEIGSGAGTTIREVVAAIARAVGAPAHLVVPSGSHGDDSHGYCVADRDLPGFLLCQTSLADGLKATVAQAPSPALSR